MSTILFLILAALLAWYGGPLLTKLFWFLPITDVAEALTPSGILRHGFSFYTSFLVWTLLLWMTLQATGLMFIPSGFQKYGETKPARFIKGAVSEVMVLALLSIPVFWLLFICGGKSLVLSHLDGGSTIAEAQWTDARIWRQGFWVVTGLWQVALPISALLYFFFQRRLKRRIGRIAEPILRFRDQGRSGGGGSARIGGVFDEWSLL